MPTEVTSGYIYEQLRIRYPNTTNSKGQWATAAEVRNFTGYGNNVRSCDFLAMSCWPSKGLHLHGHEVKVSRSDWLKEIQDVSKAGAFAQYCHYWWIVAPKGLVKLDELPATWGLLHCTAKTMLRVARPATLNESAAIDWDFFASVLRAVVDQSEMKREVDKAYQKGYRSGCEDTNKRRDGNSQSDLLRFKQLAEYHDRAIKTFELKSGIRLTDWNAGNVGEIVRTLQLLSVPHHKNHIDEVCKHLDRASKAMLAIRDRVTEMEAASK